MRILHVFSNVPHHYIGMINYFSKLYKDYDNIFFTPNDFEKRLSSCHYKYTIIQSLNRLF